MKNLIVFTSSLFLLLAGCSSDDNSTPPVASPSFTFDNQTYSVLPTSGINEIRQSTTFNDVAYNRSSISVIGMIGFSQTATISFDLFYRQGMSIAGTYTIYDNEDTGTGFEDYITPLDRACMGWTSMGAVFLTSGTEPLNANNPVGTVTITVNSPNNYKIHYVGNYRIYDDNFVVVRNVPCTMDITGTVVFQN